MATAKKATTRKTAAKKSPARKTTARKSAPKKAQASVRDSAEKFVNIYLGVIGKSLDVIQENVESARQENDKRMKDLEKRGLKLRKQLNQRLDRIESTEVVEDAREQFNKVQDQLEDVLDNVKDRLKAA